MNQESRREGERRKLSIKEWERCLTQILCRVRLGLPNLARWAERIEALWSSAV